MTGPRLLSILGVFFATLLTASAQVSVQIGTTATNYVSGESIVAVVTITNYSSSELVFQGNMAQEWLDFTVMNGSHIVSPANGTAFKGLKVPAGNTRQTSVSLSAIYGLQTMGNYTVEATVRLPGQTTTGSVSNRANFNVYTPRPFWTQTVGLPGGHRREYRVLTFTPVDKALLYTQVVDDRTGLVLNTQSLGETLNVKRPTVAIDSKQILHVLYQINPGLWAHAALNSDGRFLDPKNPRELRKPSNNNVDPVLVNNSGDVVMGGGIPYDPKAEAEARAKQRTATDRPTFGYH